MNFIGNYMYFPSWQY